MLDKRTEDGTILSYRIALITAKTAKEIFKNLSSNKLYKIFDTKLSSSKLQIYFERKIYEEIKPL